MSSLVTSETCKIRIIPRGSFRAVLLDVDCPLIVAPALLPCLQDGLLQVHHLQFSHKEILEEKKRSLTFSHGIKFSETRLSTSDIYKMMNVTDVTS